MILAKGQFKASFVRYVHCFVSQNYAMDQFVSFKIAAGYVYNLKKNALSKCHSIL